MSYPPPPHNPNEPTPPGGAPGQPPYGGAPGQPPYGGAPGQPPYGGAPGQPPYGGYPPQGQPAYTPPPSPPTSGRATTSLVLGIASLVFCGLFTGIPAIILGVKARREARESNGQVGGEGLALGGIITGALGTLLWLVVYVFVVAVVWLGAEWFDEVKDDICRDVDITETSDPNYELCY